MNEKRKIQRSVKIYKPDRCWNGFTLYGGNRRGQHLVDMDGNMVKEWKDVEHGKILPGGYILGDVNYHGEGAERGRQLFQMDWDRNIVWKFDRTEKVKMEGKEIWSARTHHDFEREGNPVGYYVPGMEPLVDKGKTLILSSKTTENSKIAPGKLLDDCILEVAWNGEVVWEWRSCEHFDEMGFSEAAKNAIYRGASLSNEYDGLHNTSRSHSPYDWLHSNSISYLGPNKWYEGGDNRFHPENIIWSGRHTNTIGIIDKDTGKFIWRIGPDYTKPELRNIGQIIGQHHAHMIPKGLPGEGNILVFDNGGFGGYGHPNPGSPTGIDNAVRPYSRVIEFNPITIEICWEYSAKKIGYTYHRHYQFYSPYMSSAQRLPNGNTLICEANKGHIIEVSSDLEIVWEYNVPPKVGELSEFGMCYRAYRVPYNWIPKLENLTKKL